MAGSTPRIGSGSVTRKASGSVQRLGSVQLIREIRKIEMKRTQRGITLIGFIGVGRGRRVHLHGHEADPDVFQYYSVKQALWPGQSGCDNNPARSRTCSSAACTSVTPGHQASTSDRAQDAGFLTVDYEVRKPLIANIDVVGSSQRPELRRGSVE
jgi:hypothetical protein